MSTRAADRLTNGRDLGRLPTEGGRRIRRGLLYRSDDTAWSQGQRSDGLPARMATAFDLRRPEEVTIRGLPWFVDENTERIGKNLAPVGTVASTIADATELAAFYLRLFQAQRENLGDIVARLARTDRLPAVVYCVAGKDRTGVTVAVLGRLLGVGNQTLIEDYARSAPFMEAVRASGQLGDPSTSAVALPLHDAPAPAMALFLEGLRATLPTTEALVSALGLDEATVERLRDRYLEAA